MTNTKNRSKRPAKSEPWFLARYEFFRAKGGGGWVGHAAEGSLHLARAEAYAEDREWSHTWDWDEGGDLGDHEVWCDAARSGEGKQCRHEILYCVLRNAAGSVLQSLCGIIDPDRDYRRIVEAELSLEAKCEIETRDRNDRKAPRYLAL